MRNIKIIVTAIGLLMSWSPCRGQSDEDYFESNVRPLLVKHCQECHGADKQEGSLRLDSAIGWRRGGDRGQAIQPGHPESSLFIKAVRYQDPDLQMPPAKQLPEESISVLEEWIKRGAVDPREESSASTKAMSLKEAETFWSFQPLDVPTLEQGNPPHHPIDQLIGEQLTKNNLTQVPLADRRTLIRRATFDLTGLPPTREEIALFLNDESDNAFETLIERLLASPAYGERWGRHWLDVARYADTAGDGSDYPVREAYKYRDWVIKAFNEDKPFDVFVQEQIAGDILAKNGPSNQYAERITATGFLAIGKRYGYKASPAYQYLDFADVIDSIGRSMLGLSIGCARCHDHKYDPISANDYYALYGIMQSTTWAFPGGEEQKRPAHFPALIPEKEVILLEKKKEESLESIDSEIAKLQQQFESLSPDFLAGGKDLGFELQSQGKPPGEPWVSSGPIEVTTKAQSPFAHVHPNGKVGVRLGSGQPTDGLRYVFENGLRATAGKKMHFTVDFRTIALEEHPGAFRFYLGRGVIQSLAVECSATSTEFAIRNGPNWETICHLEPETWYTLQITIDPAAKKYSGVIASKDELTVFDEKSTGTNWDGILDCFICDGFGFVEGAACSRDIDNVGLQETAFPAPGTQQVAPRRVGEEEQKLLMNLENQIDDLTNRRKKIADSPTYPVVYGVTEGSPVNARLQQRGEPHRLGEEIPRRNLEVLGGEPILDDSTSGRLDLANWITQPSNPLTARVFVNRVWQWHFGEGIVTTPSDFGVRGARPTNPKLLDWLASQFVASGWSLKTLHRLIMTSKTYQLASKDQQANLAIDPNNRFQWRYSRRALDAESIRDGMLAVSGKLDRTIPTQHPFPPVETWGFTIHQPFHAVYDSDHRSVYLMVQRNRRHPYLALFDSADPNQSVAKRQPTTTPTQALFLMNSKFVQDQATQFAKRIAGVPGDDRHRIIWAFETVHGQIPKESMVQDAIEFLHSYRLRLHQTESQNNQVIDSWSALARVLLTSNQFLFIE